MYKVMRGNVLNISELTINKHQWKPACHPSAAIKTNNI